MRRKTALAAAAGAFVLAAAAAWFAWGAASPNYSGPMYTPSRHGIVVPNAKGEVFTDGLEVLLLEGGSPATIEDVRSIGGDATFKFLGAKLSGPDRKLAATSYFPTYPPKSRSLGDLSDAVGARIEPQTRTTSENGYELLLGYELLDDTKLAYRTAVEVDYTVDGKTYTWRSPGWMLYCPQGREFEDCRAEAEADNWGE